MNTYSRVGRISSSIRQGSLFIAISCPLPCFDTPLLCELCGFRALIAWQVHSFGCSFSHQPFDGGRSAGPILTVPLIHVNIIMMLPKCGYPVNTFACRIAPFCIFNPLKTHSGSIIMCAPHPIPTQSILPYKSQHLKLTKMCL